MTLEVAYNVHNNYWAYLAGTSTRATNNIGAVVNNVKSLRLDGEQTLKTALFQDCDSFRRDTIVADERKVFQIN